MNRSYDLVLRQARLPGGVIADVGVAQGQVIDVAPRLARSDNDIDCAAKLLVPGLHDHHLHLLATAARDQSVDLSPCASADDMISALRKRAKELPPDQWVRAVGYDERVAGLPDRHLLDLWLPDRPLRMQDRTGALWVLNSAGLSRLAEASWPNCVERAADGQPNGRLWRGDAWLQERLKSHPPSLDPLSRHMAAWGVTAVTDAGVNNGPSEGAVLSDAVRRGELRQRLTVMGRPDLPLAADYKMGPVKLLFDERALPDMDDLVSRIGAARRCGRAVAAHCVTAGELVTYLAALEQTGGARQGDRIEHGSIIPESLIADIAKAGLIIVANPGFFHQRGDRYVAEVEPQDWPDLHRLASLIAAGIPVLAGSDAPYALPNPWIAIRAAMLRQTPSGAIIGAQEALSAEQALALFSPDCPITIGAPADYCLIDPDWPTLLMQEDGFNPVIMTVIKGQISTS